MNIKIIKNKLNQTLYLNQEIYLEKVLQEIQITNKNSKFTKMSINNKN